LSRSINAERRAGGLLAEAPKAKGAELGFRLPRNPFLATVYPAAIKATANEGLTRGL
jgi:hypothetical protein